MDLVKKNWLSILFGVIAIAAVVADFYPMGGMREKLKTEAQARAAVADQLQQLSTKQRNLPIVDPKTSDPKPLLPYPIEQTIKNATTASGLVTTAAAGLLDKAARANIHKPLVEGALPGIAGQAMFAVNFARAYIVAFPYPENGQNSTMVIKPGEIMTSVLHGGFPPTDAEIQVERDARQHQIELDNTQTVGGSATNQDQVKQMVDEALKLVPDEMRAKVAKTCKVYVDPAPGNGFAIFPGIQVNPAPEPSAIFWAQIGLWVQQDVARAIDGINQKSADVTESPVKELIKIGFEPPAPAGSTASNPSNSAMSPTVPTPLFLYPGLTYQPGSNGQPVAPPQPNPNGPPAPTIDPSGKLPADFTLSPTGRESNPVFDVVHFDVDLIVDAASVQQVLSGLESGQYISVIQLNSMESVDSSAYRTAGYFFGDKPCVKLHLRCEELFLRKWLAPLIPDSIKAQLGIQPPGGAPAAPAAGQPPA